MAETRYFRPMPKSKWEQIGEVCIDTGMLLLGDPITMNHVDVASAVDAFGKDGDEQIMRGKHPWGVLTTTGFGDGYYPVEVRIEHDRVAELRVRFIV